MDKIHLKTVVRYQENNIIGFSHDEWTSAARPIMNTPMMGAIEFVCQLTPVHSLKHDLTSKKTHKVINLIH